MKKIKEMLRRIGTAGLAAILLTAQMPVTVLAEEPAAVEQVAASAGEAAVVEQEAAVTSDEALPVEVQTDEVQANDSTGITAWDGLKTALSAGGEITLTQDITAEKTDTHLLVPKNTTATLDLNGHSINYSASSEDLTGAESGYEIIHYGAIVVLGALTIKDSGTGGTITGGTGDKAALAAYGNVTMQGGTLIGVVYLGDFGNQGYGGITMTGGTIDGQMFIDDNSSFSMRDGCTVENTRITCDGTFTMTGGSISGNNVSQVVLVGGTFTMSGGTISGTEVKDCVVETNHIFTMTGGEVSGTGKNGGIFSINPASFHISGAPKISSVYLFSDSVNKALVNIDGPLTSGASIPVISSQKPTADTPVVITSGLKKGDENAERFFTNMTDGTNMVKNSDGELELKREATEWDTLQTLLSQGGTVKLTQDYTATSVDQKLTIPASTQVTIDLNGHKIDGSKLTTEYVFYIEGAPVNTPYSTLTITDTDSGNGGKILCGNNGAVELGGGYLTFNMQGGTITSSGYPIIRTGGAGSFNMSGGTINGKITDSDTPVPGSVVVSMGVDNFHMTGGTISGTGYENVVFFRTVGAGLYPSYISGGVISGTNVTNVVNLELNSDFTASGGTIDGSSATNAVCVSRDANLSTLRFAVSSSPTIKGPVVLTCDTGSLPVTVAGALEKDISVSSDKGAVVAEADTEYTLTESDVSHIKSAVSGLAPVFGDNVVRLKKPFTSEDITIGSIQAKTYTGTPYSPAITVKDGDTVLVENTDYTISLPEGHTDAGEYTATIIGKGNDYTGEKTASFTIGKAPLTVTAKAHSITYGDAPSGGGVTCSGLVNGEKESALGGKLDYDSNYSQYGNVGSYTITPKGLTSGNYEISFRPGTLTVGKKDIRVSGITAKDKVYDGKPDAELDYTNAVFNGVVNNDELTVTASGTFADANAGENKTVNISNLTLSGSVSGNYKLAESGQQMTARATISKAEIPMEKITAPAAKTGLGYNGSAQELVTAGSVSGGIGTMKYYPARVEDPANLPTAPTDESLYTTSIPTATDAGTYHVWYKVAGDGNHNDVAAAGPLTVDIAKADFTNKTVSGNTKYGLSGTIELKELIAPGGTVGSLSITDTNEVLDGAPVLTETVLSYSFKNNSENVGKSATVTIPVNNATNYTDYSITVTLNVINCDHKNTERRDMKEATCVSKGHTGKLCCIDCGAILDEGEEIPIDPDNHQFDEGKVTTQPTIFKEGVKTFTCIRGCGHFYTVAVPRLEGEEDLSDLVEDTADLSGNEAPKVEPVKDASGNEIGQQIVIGGKEVSKTVTDPATGKETVETKVWIGGLQSSYTYTGSSIKPSIHVYDGTRKLTAGQDYSISYKNNKDAGKATVTVKFKGNYKGAKSETADFTITPAVLGQDIIAHETGVAVKKKAQKPVPVLTWKETGKEVNSKYFSITYEPGTVREAGTYTATIKPKNSGGNFTGSTTALIKVADKSKLLSSAKVTFDKKSYPYTGTAITPKYTLTMSGAALTEGRDYRMVSIADNTYPGKATVIFEAVSTNSAGYVGSKTATFKISGKKELKEGAAFSFDVTESVTYAKGGAKPEVTVTDKERGVILKEGTDYTLSYAKNKAVTNGSKTGEVRIKGKGNYKGKVTLYFAVTQQSLKAEGIAISAADQFTTRQKLKKPSVTIIDIDGKKLKEGTDYTVGQTDASDSKNTEKQGVVSFTVTGKGNYKDETIAATFRYEEKSSNIGKSKAVKKIADQAYTGKAVQLSNTELEGVLSLSGKTLVPGTDFKIISTGYSNNVKKGTAKVTVQGINTYAGTKTLSFKIVQGKVNYQGALVGGTWQ